MRNIYKNKKKAKPDVRTAASDILNRCITYIYCLRNFAYM